jgi:hypothetical protein
MIKLTDLLNEVNIAPSVNKPELLNKIADYSLYLLSYLTYSNSDINEFLDNYGYNSMEEFKQEEDAEAAELAELYLKYIRPGEVHRVMRTLEPVTGYKNIMIWSYSYVEEMDDIIILTKF